MTWLPVAALTRAWKRKRTSARSGRGSEEERTVVPDSVLPSASAASVRATNAAPLTLDCIVPAT
jgi:hypothetical protein